jgi:hypothetical protein
MTATRHDTRPRSVTTDEPTTGPVLAEAVRRAQQRLAEQTRPGADASYTSRPDHCTAP